MPVNLNPLPHVLVLSPEVATARAEGRPVVALESTIISHGMPWPQNVETALALEAEIRAEGAVPATVAVIEGHMRVGLDAAALETLGRGGASVSKASRRDLPVLLGTGGTGATTVSATMLIAARAGIRVFATGGIGGVHRGAAQTLDISADLTELGRTPVAVVCAGAKSILDIGLTLEVLETQGVPVLGYQTDRFPAFYVRDSGFAVDRRLDTPEAVAAVLHAQWSSEGLGLDTGVLVANPIPVESELPAQTINDAIEAAVAEAASAGISGKAVTPFLLERLNQKTGGRSLAANIALVRHNARVAARIATALMTTDRLQV